MTTYTHTTFAAFKSMLAARLGDPGKVHWIDDELGRTLIEAIQIHNSLTGSHRSAEVIETTPGTAFYDLPSLLPDSIGFTLTDQTVIALIEYELMEAINLTAWSGTEKWSFDTVLRAVQHRRDQFITQTQTQTDQRSIVVDVSGIVDLPDTVVAVTRAVWRGSSGVYSQLWPSDELVFQGALPQWLQAPGTPSSYSIAAVPNLQLRLFPPPTENGTLELLTVESGDTLDPTANGGRGTALGVPNDLAWGVRAGAMSDLLRMDGPARDMERASLLDQLYDLSVDLGQDLPLVLTCAINGVQLYPTSLSMVDGTAPGWQSRLRDTPDRIALAGGNLLTTVPVPDGQYSIQLQLVRNAVVPASATDNTAYVQLSRDDLEGVLAWAEMMCCFKSQGVQLENARLASKLLLDRASAYNERRVLNSTYLTQMLERSREEQIQRPIYHDSHGSGSGSGSGQRPSVQSDPANSSSSHQSRQRSIFAKRRRTLGGR